MNEFVTQKVFIGDGPSQVQVAEVTIYFNEASIPDSFVNGIVEEACAALASVVAADLNKAEKEAQ